MGDKKKENKYEGTAMLIDFFLKEYQIENAIETAKSLPDGEAKNRQMIKILDFLLEDPNGWKTDIHAIIEILQKEVGKERLETVLRIYIKRAWLHKSKMVASMLGVRLTEIEIKKILTTLLSRKNIEEAMEAAKLLDEM